MSMRYLFSILFFLKVHSTTNNIYPLFIFFQDHDGHRMCFCEEDGCNLNGSGMLKSVPFNIFAAIIRPIFFLSFFCMIWSNISALYDLFSNTFRTLNLICAFQDVGSSPLPIWFDQILFHFTFFPDQTCSYTNIFNPFLGCKKIF